jgi:hypothetical protein
MNYVSDEFARVFLTEEQRQELAANSADAADNGTMPASTIDKDREAEKLQRMERRAAQDKRFEARMTKLEDLLRTWQKEHAERMALYHAMEERAQNRKIDYADYLKILEAFSMEKSQDSSANGSETD